MSKFSEILMLVSRKILSAFYLILRWNFQYLWFTFYIRVPTLDMTGLAIAFIQASLLAWYYNDKKLFCSFFNDLTTFHTVIIFTSSKVPSAMIWKQSEWDAKRINKDINVHAKVLRKHSPKIEKQPFADVLQNWCPLKFHNILKKTMCWNLFSIKLQAEKPATSLKTGSNADVFLWISQNCKSSFFIEHLQWLLWKWLKNF